MADLERLDTDVVEDVNDYEEKEVEDTEVTCNEVEHETQTEIVPKKKSYGKLIFGGAAGAGIGFGLWKLAIKPWLDNKKDEAAEKRLIDKGYVVIKPEEPEDDDTCDGNCEGCEYDCEQNSEE